MAIYFIVVSSTQPLFIDIKKAWNFNFIRLRGLRTPVAQISKPTPFYGRERRLLTLVPF